MPFAIIPEPVCVAEENGVYCLAATSSDSAPEISSDPQFEGVVKTFFSEIDSDHGYYKHFPLSLSCTYEPDLLKEEEYRLLIRATGIYARASTPKGMHHALETLRQILLCNDTPTQIQLPCLTIHDYPKYPWRGFMLDTSRHFYSVEFIKKIISMLSLHHFSVFHWHLTDDQGWRLPVEGYEKLVSVGGFRKDSRIAWCTDDVYGGYYSKEDISQIVSFAAQRCIEVVPEVDLPGHTSALLAAYPSLGCTGGPYSVEDRFGIFADILCMGNEQTFLCIEAIFETLIELFPSQYVHIGGDEVLLSRWEDCPKCQEKIHSLGLSKTQQLQSWFTQRVSQMLQTRGKTAIAWNDVLEEKHAQNLPHNLIIMAWQGSCAGEEAVKRAHPLIMCPMTDGCYLNFKPKDSIEEPGRLGVASLSQSYHVQFKPKNLDLEKKSLLMGGQANLWSEDINSSRVAEYLLFPRITAIGEALWTQDEKMNFETFSQKLPAYYALLDILDINYCK